jgi:phosphatidylserine/phosphatidylglycerophosphate/cardiolipin synthase-like enzyme
VLGSVGKRAKKFRADKMKSLRLHARVIVRDGRDVFFGSQSLRTAELDGRREVGLIVKDPQIVKAVVTIFEKDWAETKVAREEAMAARAAAGGPAAATA